MTSSPPEVRHKGLRDLPGARRAPPGTGAPSAASHGGPGGTVSGSGPLPWPGPVTLHDRPPSLRGERTAHSLPHVQPGRPRAAPHGPAPGTAPPGLRTLASATCPRATPLPGPRGAGRCRAAENTGCFRPSALLFGGLIGPGIRGPSACRERSRGSSLRRPGNPWHRFPGPHFRTSTLLQNAAHLTSKESLSAPEQSESLPFPHKNRRNDQWHPLLQSASPWKVPSLRHWRGNTEVPLQITDAASGPGERS